MIVRPSLLALGPLAFGLATFGALDSVAIAQPVNESAMPAKPAGAIGTPTGTGRYPAIAEARAEAPQYTFYRPSRMPGKRLPLVLWGNGGCRDNGLSASHFLREVASHGYVMVANGAPRFERPAVTVLPAASGLTASPAGRPTAPPRNTPDETQTSQLLAAIKWAQAENADRTSPYFRHINISRIAVMGHSCGGLQALAAGTDPRIDAVVAFDSGVYIRANSGLSGVLIYKDDLRKLHTPVAYFIGGPGDIAYPNANDDVARIDHIPVFYANLPVGHGGTFPLVNGGEWARFGTAWLDWQLKRDRRAARWFTGARCGLCTTRGWTIVRKNFPENP